MRGLALDPESGAISLRELPRPQCAPGWITVETRASAISTGTELGKVDLAAGSLLDKARSRPDQVAKVLDAVRSEGAMATLHKVRERLATPQPLGYSLAGHVSEVGEGCEGFQVGMAVACGGATAGHAEVVVVPANLAVPVPGGVSLEDASFATIAAIALHAIRTGGVSIGDRVLVIGLGLIGQLAVRLSVAAGAHVFGVDLRADRAELGLASGAERVDVGLDSATARQVRDWSGGYGADVVLITAAGSDHSPLVLAGDAARDRARVVVVGTSELRVPRETFYHKELSLIVSRSYGPGRYDPAFEEKGIHYPVGFVPWTERRNMAEILEQLASRRLSLDGIRGATCPFERAPEAYEALAGKAGQPAPIAVVLEYAARSTTQPSRERQSLEFVKDDVAPASEPFLPNHMPRPLQITFLGMGNFASAHLLPAARRVRGVRLEAVVTSSPLKAESARRRAGFRRSETDASAAIESPGTEVVFIATRHDSHARYVEAALLASKAVFVEKPLALTPAQLDRIATTVRATQGRLMVGFNRRFAPATRIAVEALGSNRAGLRMLYRINAGALPADHWLLDPEVGGGRLIGEGCHFIDLACLVAGASASTIQAWPLQPAGGPAPPQDFRIEIAFENGASAGIEYISSGDSALPKERIEIHRSGLSIVIDDFRSAEVYRGSRCKAHRWGKRDKGHRAEIEAFLDAVKTGAPTPIAEEESIASTALTFAAARSMREARPVRREEFA
jgi:predicted dehydrogenase/threonine dehydrogenase-like Zn-dependent dehydrogenase